MYAYSPTIIMEWYKKQEGIFVVTGNSLSNENPLEKHDRFLEIVFNRIALPTFVIDHNHTIISWNLALENLTAQNHKDMIGTQNQWMAFYASKRPTLADLIVEGGKDNAVSHFYKNKFRKSPLIDDAFEAEDFFPDIGEHGEWLSFTAASIRDENGNIIGAIETLANISNEKRSKIALQESEERYKRLSITDNLTGLFNRRFFTDNLTLELERSQRYAQGFALCLIDLDNFKSMNDNYGHLFGDEILVLFSQLLKQNLRHSDTAYRYGGEEFAIVFPGSTLESASLVAERVRKNLEEYVFNFEGKSVSITGSFGISCKSDYDFNIESIIKRADQALYSAKHNGKNKIEIAEQPSS